jgi:hypothetical protein
MFQRPVGSCKPDAEYLVFDDHTENLPYAVFFGRFQFEAQYLGLGLTAIVYEISRAVPARSQPITLVGRFAPRLAIDTGRHP